MILLIANQYVSVRIKTSTQTFNTEMIRDEPIYSVFLNLVVGYYSDITTMADTVVFEAVILI